MKFFSSFFFAFIFAFAFASADLSVSIDKVSAASGSTVTVPVRISGLSSASPMLMSEFYINFDESKLKLLSIRAFSAALPESEWVYNTNSRPIALNWIRPDMQTVALNDNSALFELEFEYLASEIAVITWSNEYKSTVFHSGSSIAKVEWNNGSVAPAAPIFLSLAPNKILGKSAQNLIDLNKTAMPNATGGSGAYEYIWKNSKDSEPIANPSAYTVSNGFNNFYVYAKDTKTKSISETKKYIVFKSAMKEGDGELGALSAIGEISFYPNPATDKISLNAEFDSDDAASVKIVDMLGSSVFEKNYGSKSSLNVGLNVSKIKSGSYMLIVKHGESSVTEKLMISK